jgi:hypothetical protein
VPLLWPALFDERHRTRVAARDSHANLANVLYIPFRDVTPVNARVGNVKNNDPSLIEPVAAA